MKTYKVKYSLWRVQANTEAEARAKALAMLQKNMSALVTVEKDTSNRSFLSMLLWG